MYTRDVFYKDIQIEKWWNFPVRSHLYSMFQNENKTDKLYRETCLNQTSLWDQLLCLG